MGIAKKSFAAILKEKRAAASKEVSVDFLFFLFSLSYFFFIRRRFFQTFELLSFAMRLVALIHCIERATSFALLRKVQTS